MSVRQRSPLALTTLLVVLVAGCSSPPNDAESSPGPDLPPFTETVSAPESDVPPFADSEALSAAMLAVTDLPLGYTVLDLPPADSDPAATDTVDDRSGTDPAACAGVLAAVANQVPGAVADASVTFSGPDFSSVDSDAASYPVGGAATAFDTVQNTVRQCPQFTGTDADGVTVNYQVGAVPDDADARAPVGDASVMFTVQTSSEGITLVSDAVVAVVGSTVVQVVATGQDSVDAVLLRDLADTAAGRLRGDTGN